MNLPLHTASGSDLQAGLASPAEPMTRFERVSRNVMTGMLERQALLAQPPETFRPFFDGRVPSLLEKIQFVEGAIQRMTSLNIYENNLYHVEITYSLPFIHINIHRHDGKPCTEPGHFQVIKDELVGVEYEAVELFPAESRLVDTSNEYHLWVCADRNVHLPFIPPEQTETVPPVVMRSVFGHSQDALPAQPQTAVMSCFGN
jgi:hypothetical protein